MLADLPQLCIYSIIKILTTSDMSRRHCDIVRDCIVLAATSRDTRATLAVCMAEVINPPNAFEMLAKLKSVLAIHLKQTCRDHLLAVSGNKSVMHERLRSHLEDCRYPGCLLGRVFCQDAGNQFVLRACARAHAARKHAATSRRMCLVNALAERGCVFRQDSQVSRAFIEGVGRRTLDATVDCAEEMQFLYHDTDYLKILTTARRYATDDGEDVGCFANEVKRRSSSKQEAIRRWTIRHQTHTSSLPRSLRLAYLHCFVQGNK